ncbi:amidase [Profundibacter sp.]|uniref:amidase n=1 Tax=Profundibacter sp. TaxID=3101071 RepID=UPI003D0C416E
MIQNSDATGILAALTNRDISATDLMAQTLARIDTVNPAVNAIVALRPADDLLAEAKAADNTAPKGPLHGLPIAIKDLAETKGLHTTFGSPIFADNIPTADSLMVARIRAAGAIIIGKTNTPEFGLGSHSFNPVYGTTCNPYDTTRSAGGSSGGAAVALTTRMLALADGSDMMGSLRNPAAWNNVYGFRPSYGMVPSDPIGDTFLHQLSTNGPMARSIRDLSLLLQVIGTPDARLPHSMAAFRPLPDTSTMSGTTIGWVGDWGGYYPMNPEILTLCETALDQMRELGATIVDFTPPIAPEQLWHSWTTLRSWAIAAKQAPLYQNPKTRDLLKPEMLWEIERGLSLSPLDIHNASVIRSKWFAAFASQTDVDVMALPSAQIFPFNADWRWPKTVMTRDMDSYHRWMEVVVPASLTGLPALNVPVGFGKQGLPAGLQLIGQRGADARILQLGQTWHTATDWPNQRPPNFPP